jgi:hypothetical protein
MPSRMIRSRSMIFMDGKKNTARIAILCLTSCLPSTWQASSFHSRSSVMKKEASMAWLSGLSKLRWNDKTNTHQHSSMRGTHSKKLDGVSVAAMRLKNDYSPVPFFKGWAKPGLEPPGISGTGLVVEDGETLDAICGTRV